MKAEFTGSHDDTIEGVVSLSIGGISPGNTRYQTVIKLEDTEKEYYIPDVPIIIEVGDKVKLYFTIYNENSFRVECIEKLNMHPKKTLWMIATNRTEIEY